MNFDLDDALGSDDSFFEEPKALSKRASAKTSEKKSVENLFNLTDAKETLSEAPQKSKSIVTFDESSIKQDELLKKGTTDFRIKTQKKKNNDWLGESEPVSGVQEKLPKRTDFLDDLLSGRPLSPKEKKGSSEDILRKDSQLSTLPQSSASVKESSTDVISNFSILSGTSRERRRSRRGSSSGFEAALGLFGEDYSSADFYTKETKPQISKAATDGQSKSKSSTEKVIPDWLGGALATTTKIDDLRPEEHVKEDVLLEESSKVTEKDNEQTNKSDVTVTPEDYKSSVALKQQQLNLDLQSTYASLQQQESFLLISLQLKKYEEYLESIKHQQREILEKQEKRFDTILNKYALKQQMMESNIRLQQERLNNHMQLLISQPIKDTETIIDDSDNGTLRKSNDNENFENIIGSLKRKHNEELFLLEESYKRQIDLLEKSSEAVEERLKNEISYITTIFEEKINNIKQNNNEELLFYKQKVNSMLEQHNSDIMSIKEYHARVLQEMKEEYATHIEYLKEFSKKENELLNNGQFYSQKLENSIDLLHNNISKIQEMQDKINQDSNIISVARQSSMESREKEIILMRNNLQKCREAAEIERSQLLALIRSLETKIAEQNINAQEDRWALQQALATLAARSASLEREIEYNRTINEREREQLKTLKASLLAEQENMVVQITEEKLKLSAEKARIETSNKLTNNYEIAKIKSEAETAIQVAKELSEKVNQEREFLYRQKNDMEIVKRELADRERELQNKEMNLEYLIESTQRKIQDDKRIIYEAKKLESKYKDRLQELQNQWSSLADREKKLAEEKVLLSKERLALYTAMKQSKNCALCKGNDVTFQNNYYGEENWPTTKIQDTNSTRIRLDLIEDEKSSEVSKEESNIL